MEDLFKQSFKASIWSSAAEVAAKVLSPLVFLILTRILSPADFGIVAVATTILAFTNIIVDIGSSKVLIQSQLKGKEFDGLCDTAFWINIIIGLVLFFACFIGSARLAVLNNSPQSSNVIKVMSLQVLFNSLSIVQTSLFKRELNFKVLFIIRLVTIGTPALISIPIAFWGGGYWSIVIGSVLGSALSCLTLWIMSKWKPKFKDISSQVKTNFKRLLSKSVWTTIDQIISYVPLALDTYLISNYLSERDLGLYSSSRTLFNAIMSLTLAPILPVLFTSFSKLQSNPAKFKNSILTSQKIIFTLAASIGLIIFGFREFITDILFDSSWRGIENCIGIIFLVFGVEYFYSAVVEGVRATGQFKGLAINTSICTLITAILLIIAVKWGFLAYILSRSLTLFLWYPGVFIMSNMKLNLSFFSFLKNVWREILGWILLFGYFVLAARFFTDSQYLIISIVVTLIYNIYMYNVNKLLVKTLYHKLFTKLFSK